MLLDHKVPVCQEPNNDETTEREKQIDGSGDGASGEIGPSADNKINELHPLNVNVTDVNGSTPLHLSVVEGHTQLAELLLQNGSEVNLPIISHEGRSTALMEVRGHLHVELILWF